MDNKIIDLYRKVGIIYRLTQHHFNEQLLKENLSFIEYTILVNIDSQGTFQEDIIKIIITDKAQVTRLLNGLETKKYITRQQDEQDKRTKRIFLTQLGKQKLTICLNILSHWHDHISSQFGNQLLNTANQVIDTLYNNTIDYHHNNKNSSS